MCTVALETNEDSDEDDGVGKHECEMPQNKTAEETVLRNTRGGSDKRGAAR